MPTRKIGRDASTGRFLSVVEARKRPATAIVETYPVSGTSGRRLQRRRAVRHLTEENQNRTGFKAGGDL
jgi:hypothetical protein